MVSFHKRAISWHLIHATRACAASKICSNVSVLSSMNMESESVLITHSLVYYRYEKLEGKQFSVPDANYFVFHSPYNKVIHSSSTSCSFSLFYLLCLLLKVSDKDHTNSSLQILQLVQKSFARLLFNDFLRNAR